MGNAMENAPYILAVWLDLWTGQLFVKWDFPYWTHKLFSLLEGSSQLQWINQSSLVGLPGVGCSNQDMGPFFQGPESGVRARRCSARPRRAPSASSGPCAARQRKRVAGEAVRVVRNNELGDP